MKPEADTIYRVYRKFVPYAKVMYGRGVFNYPPLSDGFRPNLAYNLVARTHRTDYRVKPWLYARADWEYQTWLGFQNSSLSPNIFTVARLSVPDRLDSASKTQGPGQRRGFSIKAVLG